MVTNGRRSVKSVGPAKSAPARARASVGGIGAEEDSELGYVTIGPQKDRTGPRKAEEKKEP